MRHIILKIAFALLCASGITPAAAQGNDIFTAYGIDNGLSQSSIWSIVQDRNGFIWVSTSDGICRFDGYNFTVYRNDVHDSSSLISGQYYRLFTDRDQSMWIITQSGICKYDDITDKFTRFFSYNGEHLLETFNCIFGDDGQYIWAGFTGYALLKIDKRTLKVTVNEKTGYEKVSSFLAWQHGFIDRGVLWIMNADGQLYSYNTRTAHLARPVTPALFALGDFNDTAVIAATTDGLILINKSDLSFKILPFKIPISKKDRAKVLTTVSPSTIVLGTSAGIFYIDTHTWAIQKSITSFVKGRGHSYNNVHCLYHDRSGNMWIGTNGEGLKKLAAAHKKFKSYSSYNDSSNLVKSIYADEQKLYIGYFGNGLDIFDRDKGFIKNASVNIHSEIYRHTYGICSIDSGILMLSMDNKAIPVTYNIKNGKCAHLASDMKEVLPGAELLVSPQPYLYKKGNLVYSGLDNYLIAFDISRPRYIKTSVVYKFINAQPISTFKDNAGNLWVGSINGIFCLQGDAAIRMPLPESVWVKTINEDSEGNIWVGTIKGIYIIDRKTRKLIRQYTDANGLSNNFIYGILRDDDGNMWFSHNKGLSVFKKATKTFRHYTVKDGLQSNEFNTGAYFKAADGTLFFGGINGTNGFHPAEIKDNPNLPAVRITHIKLFDLPLKTDTAHWNIHTLELPYTDNTLSFEFAGLEYTDPSQNQYAYIMEGFDEKWINSGDKRFARYPGMPPGKYIFKVKASNNDGIWQNIPATIAITIVPPYWQQLWFRILAVLFFAVCISGIMVWIQRQQYKRKMRAIELQQKIQRERERISHNMHDNVGTQLSLISNNIDWVEHPLKPLTETEKTDKLQFVSQTAKDIIATLRETIWALDKEAITLEISDKLKAFAQKQLVIYPQIELLFYEEINGNSMLGPSEALNLFRICQEAIANALKYSGAKRIIIEIRNIENKYAICITDNGSGFDTGKVNSSIQNGIENMKYRAADIGGALEISTGVHMGTTVTITKNNTNAV